MTHPYLLALGVGYALDRSGFTLQDLFDEMFGLAPDRVEQPPGVGDLPPGADGGDPEDVEVTDEPPAAVEVIEEPPAMELPPEEVEVIPEPEPPFVDPFIPDLDILPPELEGPIPEDVLERAREKYGPSGPLGPLGLESPFLEAEEEVPGFVAPPLEVFVRTILPPVRAAPTLQALIRPPASTAARIIAPTVSPTISPATIARTQLRGQFAPPSLFGLRFS